MEKIITYENLKSFAYVNDAICKKPIRGIAISFFGLGGMDMYDIDTPSGELYAEHGILYVVPYNNPWAWMNRQAVSYTDEIIDVLIEKYGLSDDIPIISTGNSMGGMSAIVYTMYAKRTPVCCVANCPVCDTVFHFTERPDLPRSLYSAMYNEEGTMDEALARISPIHLAESLPRIRYHIFHCCEDKKVNIYTHSERFVERMKSLGHDMTYDRVPGRDHCKLTLPMQRKFESYVIESISD